MPCVEVPQRPGFYQATQLQPEPVGGGGNQCKSNQHNSHHQKVGRVSRSHPRLYSHNIRYGTHVLNVLGLFVVGVGLVLSMVIIVLHRLRVTRMMIVLCRSP